MRRILNRVANNKLIAAIFLVGLVLPLSAKGQRDVDDESFQPIDSLRGFVSQGGPGSLGSREILISAQYFSDSTGRQGMLEVTAQLAANWHIYSITQPRGGPKRTEIVVEPVPAVTSWGLFQPLTPPEIKELEFMPVSAEEHHGQVTWRAPLKFAEGTTLQTLVIHGEIRGQICQDEGVCLPLDGRDTTFVAGFAGVADDLFGPAPPEAMTGISIACAAS